MNNRNGELSKFTGISFLEVKKFYQAQWQMCIFKIVHHILRKLQCTAYGATISKELVKHTSTKAYLVDVSKFLK